MKGNSINRPKLANCSPKDVIKALKKLGGFLIKDSRHIKIIHIKSGKSSTIPRSRPINRNLLKDFIEEYLIKELRYSEAEIYKYLWC
ncbi:MAG: hypothetical protein ABIJ84_01780 [bacterium]